MTRTIRTSLDQSGSGPDDVRYPDRQAPDEVMPGNGMLGFSGGRHPTPSPDNVGFPESIPSGDQFPCPADDLVEGVGVGAEQEKGAIMATPRGAMAPRVVVCTARLRRQSADQERNLFLPQPINPQGAPGRERAIRPDPDVIAC